MQIVGSTLRDDDESRLVTNFETRRSPAEFATMYKKDNVPGGHVIALGPGNEEAALSALRAYPGGLHMGGGVTPENAPLYLDAGASHVIVTSYVFHDGQIHTERLNQLVKTVGKSRLVLDLSCRWRDGQFWVVTDRWQRFSDVKVNAETLASLANSCDEFLVHGVDVEGQGQGIIPELVELLGKHSPIPVTYAGGARTIDDLEAIKTMGRSRVDATIGTALDIFGGDLPYRDVIAWQRRQEIKR